MLNLATVLSADNFVNPQKGREKGQEGENATNIKCILMKDLLENIYN